MADTHHVPLYSVEPDTGRVTEVMSLRDYFAGEALKAIADDPRQWIVGEFPSGKGATVFSPEYREALKAATPKDCAHRCYEFADAMLMARAKETQP